MIKLKAVKIIIVFAVFLFTVLCTIYLIYVARNMEKYTIAELDGDKYFIVYSSESLKTSDEHRIEELLGYIKNCIHEAGFDIAILEYKNEKQFNRDALKLMKKEKQYILIDIGLSNLLVNKNTLLIRAGVQKADYTNENIEYALRLKKRLDEENIKINVLPDTKKTWNSDMGYRSLRIDICSKNSIEECKNLIFILFKVFKE